MLTLLLGMAAPDAGAAKLAGSDLLAVKCGEVLKKNAASIPDGLQLMLDGSLRGERRLRDGTADAALLILPDKSKVPEIVKGEWEAVPIAYQTVIVVVNKFNKLEQIDLPTLAAIYGKRQDVDIQYWSGIKESGLEMPISAVSTRYDMGIVAPLFRSRVLGDEEYKTSILFRHNDAAAEDYVISSLNAIAILSVPPVREDRVKTLAVYNPQKMNAYLPTASNLYNGDYPLVVPMYFVVPRKSAAAVKPILQEIFGDPMAGALQESGFMPVPKNLRTNFIQKLDKLP